MPSKARASQCLHSQVMFIIREFFFGRRRTLLLNFSIRKKEKKMRFALLAFALLSHFFRTDVASHCWHSHCWHSHSCLIRTVDPFALLAFALLASHWCRSHFCLSHSCRTSYIFEHWRILPRYRSVLCSDVPFRLYNGCTCEKLINPELATAFAAGMICSSSPSCTRRRRYPEQSDANGRIAVTCARMRSHPFLPIVGDGSYLFRLCMRH